MKDNYDIIIIGAGPVGLSFANAVARMDLNVAIIEKLPEAILAKPPYDGRETALTHMTKDIMTRLGQWELVGDANISLIKHAKVLNGKSPYSLHFDHSEAGEDNLGFMISNHDIRRAAYQAVQKFKQIDLLAETEMADIKTDDSCGTVTLSDGKKITAPLIVAADSRFSPAREIMNITTSKYNFNRTCVVTKMKISGEHEDTAWECFHYDRTLAVLPLNNKHVSVVITLDTNDTDDLLSMSDDAFGLDMEERTEGRYGKMKLSEKLYSYPLMATYAEKFYAKRFALLGDAAVGMHPVTAHGFNLGLRGANTLAKEIKTALETGTDIGSNFGLARFNKQHRSDTKPIYMGTNALVKLYTNTKPHAKLTRQALLHLGNIIKPAKDLITNQLTESK